MPNIKSAMKRVKVSSKRNLRNRIVKSNIKTSVKKFEAALAGNDIENANTLMKDAISCIDKATGKGVIHKNTANRKKARLTRRLDLTKAAQ